MPRAQARPRRVTFRVERLRLRLTLYAALVRLREHVEGSAAAENDVQEVKPKKKAAKKSKKAAAPAVAMPDDDA